MSRLLTTLGAMVCCIHAFTQDTPALLQGNTYKADKIAADYVSAVGKKADKYSNQISKSTSRYLHQLQKEESKLQSRAEKLDSLRAHNIFANASNKYQQLEATLKSKAGSVENSTGIYLPWQDTTSTALKYLAQNPFAGNMLNASAVSGALGKVKNLEAQLNDAEAVKTFIREREEYLKEQLAGFDAGSELRKYNTTCVYYSQQIKDYKDALKDPTRAEQKALSELRKIPAFASFMQKFSLLGGLFDIPRDYGTSGLNGLQTINSVRQLVESRIGTMGSGGLQAVQASISAGQAQLNQIRNRLSQPGGDSDIPGFTPSSVKTKPIKKRLVYSTDMTTIKNSTLFPLSTDFGASIGYKATDRLTAGLGLAYKVGFGKDLKHIDITSQGLDLRSYVDWKIRKQYFISGGMELNYLSQFKNIKVLENYSAWQKSGLVGISRTVSLKSRHFSATKISVYYDCLHQYQVPRSQAIILRAGYVIN